MRLKLVGINNFFINRGGLFFFYVGKTQRILIIVIITLFLFFAKWIVSWSAC
jgi:hypothetical protein